MKQDARSHIERAGYRVQLVDREAARPGQVQPPGERAQLDPGRVGQPLDGQAPSVEHAPDALRDAEAGALLLEALAERDAGSAELARDAVVIVNQADPKSTPAELARVAEGYRSLAREAVTVPHDPAMVDGVLRFGSLRPETQRAWLAAGAAVARGL